MGLNTGDIVQADREFSAFDDEEAHRQVYLAVKEAARRATPSGGEVEVTLDTQGYDIKARGVSEAEMMRISKMLQNVQEQALTEFAGARFYQRIDNTHIMPDHVRIALRYVPAMAPLAAAVRNSLQNERNFRDIRKTINFVLHFYQSIPYDKLEDRYTSNGAGFETPYTLLVGNKGDCDSKAVAMAATLRAIYPDLPLIFVYARDHAFIGIGIRQGPRDFALAGKDGNAYVLADPTGPAMLDLGEAAEDSLEDIRQGKYSYLEIPFR